MWKPPIALNLLVRRSTSATPKLFDDESVILDIGPGQFYTTNHVGPFFWELLEHDVTISELVDVVSMNYSIDLETANEDIEELILQPDDADLVTEWK
jgi:hypothetical protein